MNVSESLLRKPSAADLIKQSLGIDIGTVSVKMCMLEGESVSWAEVEAHDGNVRTAVERMFTRHNVPTGLSAMVTGGEGRRQFKLESVIETIAIETALAEAGHAADAVVSLGGEELVLYKLDERGRVSRTYAGSKCAAGTGEFFAQQLKRMDLGLDDVGRIAHTKADVCRLSSRCSVFMKSDCTHKLNKGEAGRDEIVVALSRVMAGKVLDYLGKARISEGRVLIVGGPSKNTHLVEHLRSRIKDVEFIVPPEASWISAYGAALLAKKSQSKIAPMHEMISDAAVEFPRAKPFADAASMVTFHPSRRTRPVKGRIYALGIDGGSTTTKVALVDVETKEIAAAHYGRTLGDPVSALRRCLAEIKSQVTAELGENPDIKITLAAATGSSRELLGVFAGTEGVYNEIIAHTAGTTFFDPQIDTIFEIGGQDAKYVSLNHKVPVEYAMNEACSAGTGSFLEESASGDLNILRAADIGPMALAAKSPLKFGEHCSAFINSDIRKAISQGASREDITAGLVLSIVSNYLNRVVGNRRIGERIVVQGGVAKNPAIPLAFASESNRHIVVPPDPELMGAFGVALIAIEKAACGDLSCREFTLDSMMTREITGEKDFRCKSCDNDCPVRILNIGEDKYFFGGRCSKYANRRIERNTGAVNYVDTRRRLLFEDFTPKAGDFIAKTKKLTAIPAAFTIHTLWPLFSNFFHEMGVPFKLVENPTENGSALCESSFCFPGELAHALMDRAVQEGADFYFLPQIKRLPSLEKDVHATFCPITQGMPYYLRSAFRLEDSKILRPVFDMDGGMECTAVLDAAAETAERFGIPRFEAERAWKHGVQMQKAAWNEMAKIGSRVIEEASTAGRPVIVLFGRSYNALTSMANMGIPRKFSSRGYSVLPYDFLPITDEKIYPNMYWHYGQADLKGTALVKAQPNLFACFITNFSCAPDSFILHYLRWMYNSKPYLVLELDSHTADAGVDTRIEAFLDIVEGWRHAAPAESEMLAESDWKVETGGELAEAVHRVTGERRSLKHPKVKLLWPNMGKRSTEFMSALCRINGINSEVLRHPDMQTATRARAVASGKECIPALLVLGSFLEYFDKNQTDPDTCYLLFMPITTGPCRTGQYAVFFHNLFREMGRRNVAMLMLNSDNSYTELGKGFSRQSWISVALADYLKDIENSLRALAADPAAAQHELEEVYSAIMTEFNKGTEKALAVLPALGDRLRKIPLIKPLKDAARVMVVGEIFVRRDDYSVEPLIANLAARNVVAKVAGITEWVHYLDSVRDNALWTELKKIKWYSRFFSRTFFKYLDLHLSMWWMNRKEHQIVKALGRSRLIPKAPHGMRSILSRTKYFSHKDFQTEATISSCVAAAAMEEGYQGVAVIAPFACLPGRVIEAVFSPFARDREWPVLNLENDGNPYPPHVINRIEVFAHNVSRKHN